MLERRLEGTGIRRREEILSHRWRDVRISLQDEGMVSGERTSYLCAGAGAER